MVVGAVIVLALDGFPKAGAFAESKVHPKVLQVQKELMQRIGAGRIGHIWSACAPERNQPKGLEWILLRISMLSVTG
jgi:hypothetical protein